MTDYDHIGVVREHRWASAKLQRERLKADGCRVILDMKDATRTELLRIVRPGSTVKLFRAYYLADPRNRKKKGGMAGDATEVLRRLCERGAIVKDVETGLSTAEPAQKTAIIASIKDQATRDGKGLNSVANGRKSTKGRPVKEFPLGTREKVGTIWFDSRLSWEDCRAKLKPLGVSVDRAYEWFGKRNKDR